MTLLLVTALGMVSCSPDYETEFAKSTLTVPHKSQATILMPLEGGQHQINVETNVPLEKWFAEANADWCKVTKKEGEVEVVAGPYEGYRSRQATVSIYYGHQKYDILVVQSGLQADLKIPENDGYFRRKEGMIKMISPSATEVNIPMLTNLEVDHVLIPDTSAWVHFDASQKQITDESGLKILKLTVDKNTENDDRYSTIILQSSMNYDILCQFVLIQSKIGYLVVPAYKNAEIKVEDGGEHLRIPFQYLFTDGSTYKIEIPENDQSWVELTNSTNGNISNEIDLLVKPNEVESPRSTIVKYTNINKPEQTYNLAINQHAFVPVAPFNVVNLKAIPGEGSIKLTWEKPEKINYSKVVITCHNNLLNTTTKQVIENKDVLSCVFDNTYAFAGDYQFTVKTYGVTGLETDNPLVISAQSGEWVRTVKIHLTPSMITANATQNGDGQGIPGLVDGNTSTYYHTLWKNPSPGGKPHYVQIELDRKSSKEFYFDYDGRSGNDQGDVKRVRIYGSNSGVDNDAAWTDLGVITYDMKGDRGKATNHIKASQGYKYLRYVPEARRSSDPLDSSGTNGWWNMSELKYYEVHDEEWVQANK